MDLAKKRFLFSFRNKINQMSYIYRHWNIQVYDAKYDEAYRKINFQAPWTDVIHDKLIINRYSYLLDWLRFVIPYRQWLRILFLAKLPLIRHLDSMLFNLDILIKMIYQKCDVFVYYDRNVYRITETILSKLNKLIIEYDGRPLGISKRILTNDIHCDNKFLVSNMDWKNKLGKRKENFRQIVLGFDKLAAEEINNTEKIYDLTVVGSFNPKIFIKRCEYMNFIMGKLDNKYNIQLFGGEYIETEKYSYLNKIENLMTRFEIFGKDFWELMKKTKMTVVIPSEDHLKIASGMPLRLYENAAFGVFQLIYRTDAINNTCFKENEDFVFFNSKEELAEKIEYYLIHHEERDKIAQNAKKKFLDNYTAQQTFSDLLKSIEYIIRYGIANER